MSAQAGSEMRHLSNFYWLCAVLLQVEGQTIEVSSGITRQFHKLARPFLTSVINS
jgi:hypothetical protein